MFIKIEFQYPVKLQPRFEKLILIYPNEDPVREEDGVMVGMTDEQWMATEMYKKIIEREVKRAEEAHANKMAREAKLAAQVTLPLKGVGLKITLPDGTVFES